MSEENQQEELEVIEEKDGSITVEVSEEVVSEDQGQADDQSDEDHPSDTDAIREARRARRRAKKDMIKRTNEEKDHRLTLLQKQNQELTERLAVMERRTNAADLARLEKAIEDEELRYRWSEDQMKKAIGRSDGDAVVKAQNAMYQAKRNMESLVNAKERFVRPSQNEDGAVDPQLQRHASQWMERNPWYDPNGEDDDTEIAKVIDKKLVKEGWDPKTSEYWEELDNRLSKRLPHLYNRRHAESERRKPRSVVTGSQRESSSGGSENSVLVPPEYVRALKEAGMWDDPVMKKKMIQKYAQTQLKNRD